MYCPRCGAQNTETTKFCRQCGLPLQQISGYVATGGTGALAQTPAHSAPPPVHLGETAEMLALKHKKTMTILSVCIAPIIFAVISESILHLDELAAIPFLLVPLGVMWASFRYKAQLRSLQERQLQQYYAAQQAPAPQPMFQSQPYQPQLNAPRTNPLAEVSPGSIVEDETRKLPEHHR